MNHLADAVLDYLWFLTFTEDDAADPDVLLKQMEGLIAEIESEFSDEEKLALRAAATCRLGSWLSEPDEHGYSPRKLLTTDQRRFLRDMAAGNWSGSSIEDQDEA
jgi:hypothetical protein